MIGMPIVGLATTEMATVIENGVSGFVDTDVGRLIDPMRDLLGDPGEAREMGERARGIALERFSIDRFARDWEEAFAEVTGRASAEDARRSTLACGGWPMTRRIALISEHASPLATLGGVDSGGQNVYVGQVARAPRRDRATRSTSSPAATRRTCRNACRWPTGVRVVHVPAGPAAAGREGGPAPLHGRVRDVDGSVHGAAAGRATT